jgi:hypothetical protein
MQEKSIKGMIVEKKKHEKILCKYTSEDLMVEKAETKDMLNI